MLVLAMEFSRGSVAALPAERAAETPRKRAASAHHRTRAPASPERPRTLRPVPLPQNGTEVPDHPRSAPRETDGLRPWRCSGDRIASDRHRSFRARQIARTVTP
jgi:hypothetical protein